MTRPYPPVLKRFGQHFLADPSVIDRIVEALQIQPGDTVVEIGPGRGVLTSALADRASKLIAIELDKALAQLLRERYANEPQVDIVEADVLSVPLGEVGGEGYVLAGNVPYYITTPILFHALKPPFPKRAVFLVQKEVAERALAAPGSKTYGALSVNLQTVAAVEIVCDVPPSAFRPPPKVDSAVMRVTPLPSPLVAPHEIKQFRGFVQSVFALRRKQLVRIIRTVMACSAEDALRYLETAGFDPAARPETLSPSDFARLFATLQEGASAPLGESE